MLCHISMSESEYARDEHESEIASRALKDEGLNYALSEHPREVEEAVREWLAEEWLDQSRDWIQLVSIISQHDRGQLKESIRRRVVRDLQKPPAFRELQLFDVASEVSKLIESVASPQFRIDTPNGEEPAGSASFTTSSLYGYRPGPTASPLAPYARVCTISDDLSWVSELISLTRAFREILFIIGDASPHLSLEWQLSDHMRAVDIALAKGSPPTLSYRGLHDKRPKFGREFDPERTPLSSSLASWISEYLTEYMGRIDLGTCVECGKIFARQRRDNSYCSKTCQNRVAYKRKKIFESGLLEKIDVTQRTASQVLKAGVWVYHQRLGLGVIEDVKGRDRAFGAVAVRFPGVVRAFFRSELFSEEQSSPKLEFYNEKDAAALAELL